MYCINSARNGKSIEPCLTFGQIMKHDSDKEKPCKNFSDIAHIVDGTWVRRKEVALPARGEAIVDGDEGFNRPFSKSSFDAYYSCPRCYMFRSLLQTEERKSSEFGNLIHAFAELYACHRKKVLEMGTDAFLDIISDRYTGLSSPTMEEIDRDAVKLAMDNVVRYLDMKGVVALLDTYNSTKRHPNRFLEELGLLETSTMCEIDHFSMLHQIHGEFDLYWNGTITDYKTGRGRDSSEIAKAMAPRSGTKRPEFQPLIYLALASEMPSSSGNFEMFYAMDNDVESSKEGFDIRRNIRTVRLVPGDLREAMRNSAALEDAMKEGLRKELKDHAAVLIAVAADCAEGNPSKWKGDQALVEAFVERTGFKIKDIKKVVGTAIGKLTSKLTAGMITTDRLVEVPKGTLDRFLETLDTMHREAVELSFTDLPARPVIDCRKCDFFEACTRDAEHISSEEVTGDE